MNDAALQQAGHLTPAAIQAALRRPLPGLPAMVRMAPMPRPLEPPTPDHRPREGGVLVLLYPGGPAGDLHLVLTRRTDSVGNHRGQISFPGGTVDPGDPSTAYTAMREACEEIGVCEDDLQLLGDLTPLYIPPSDYYIYPHVAWVPRRPDFDPQPDEVAELLEPPIAHFLDERNIVVEDWLLRGELRQVPFYNVCGHKVWGATAMVLAELAAALATIR
ncbi:MAG TPA: CoA pyrophosphatase [Anaerolineae bacterium]|nr:CoA pyrophosphatase [Anaerolineae bacterium]